MSFPFARAILRPDPDTNRRRRAIFAQSNCIIYSQHRSTCNHPQSPPPLQHQHKLNSASEGAENLEEYLLPVHRAQLNRYQTTRICRGRLEHEDYLLLVLRGSCHLVNYSPCDYAPEGSSNRGHSTRSIEAMLHGLPPKICAPTDWAGHTT
jgi:hypothetical protein